MLIRALLSPFKVVQQFNEAGFMVDLNADQGTTFNKKIRSAQLAQYNYIFGKDHIRHIFLILVRRQISFVFFIVVVGDKENESGTVNIRSRGGKQLGRRPVVEVLTSLSQLRDSRSNLDEF